MTKCTDYRCANGYKGCLTLVRGLLLCKSMCSLTTCWQFTGAWLFWIYSIHEMLYDIDDNLYVESIYCRCIHVVGWICVIDVEWWRHCICKDTAYNVLLLSNPVSENCACNYVFYVVRHQQRTFYIYAMHFVWNIFYVVRHQQRIFLNIMCSMHKTCWRLDKLHVNWKHIVFSSKLCVICLNWMLNVLIIGCA